jgi:predicted porin
MKLQMHQMASLVLAAGLSAGAHAQAMKTETYGKIHLEANNVKTSTGPGRTELRDSASRAGIRGTRVIGDGFVGLFGAELSFASDAGTFGATPLRAAYVGMDTPFGTFAGGRLDNGSAVGSPFYNQLSKITTYAPNDSGITAWTDDFMNPRNRVSNALGYRTAKGKDYDIRARYFLRGTNNVSENTASSFDLGGEYKFGNLQIGLGYGKDMKDGGLVASSVTTSDFKEKNQIGLRLSTGSISPYFVTGTDKYVQHFDTKTKLATNRAKVNYSVVGADYSIGKHTVALNFLSRDIQNQLVGTRKMTQLGYTYELSPKDILQAYVQNDGVDNSKTNNHVKVFGVAYLYRF